jgi:hypothetical protein
LRRYIAVYEKRLEACAPLEYPLNHAPSPPWVATE